MADIDWKQPDYGPIYEERAAWLNNLRENPEILKHAPHRSTIHHVDHDALEDPKRWAITWRAYQRKYRGYFEPRS